MIKVVILRFGYAEYLSTAVIMLHNKKGFESKDAALNSIAEMSFNAVSTVKKERHEYYLKTQQKCHHCGQPVSGYEPESPRISMFQIDKLFESYLKSKCENDSSYVDAFRKQLIKNGWDEYPPDFFELRPDEIYYICSEGEQIIKNKIKNKFKEYINSYEGEDEDEDDFE